MNGGTSGFPGGDSPDGLRPDTFAAITPAWGDDGNVYVAFKDSAQDAFFGYVTGGEDGERMREQYEAVLSGDPDAALEDDVLALYDDATADIDGDLPRITVSSTRVQQNGQPVYTPVASVDTAEGGYELPGSFGMLLAVRDGADIDVQVDQNRLPAFDAARQFPQQNRYFQWVPLGDHPFAFTDQEMPAATPTADDIEMEAYTTAAETGPLTAETADAVVEAAVDYYLDQKAPTEAQAREYIKQQVKNQEEAAAVDEDVLAATKQQVEKGMEQRMRPQFEQLATNLRVVDTDTERYLLLTHGIREAAAKTFFQEQEDVSLLPTEVGAELPERTARHENGYVTRHDPASFLSMVLDAADRPQELYIETASPTKSDRVLPPDSDDKPADITAEAVPQDVYLDRDGTLYALPGSHAPVLLDNAQNTAVHVNHTDEPARAFDLDELLDQRTDELDGAEFTTPDDREPRYHM